MNINVKSLNVSIQTERKYTFHNEYENIDKVEGKINVSINGRKITNNIFLHADQIIDVQDLSPETQQKIIEVFATIKNELNEGLQ